MATLYIKNFPCKLLNTLEGLAKRENPSLREEVVYLLRGAVPKAEEEKISIWRLRGLGKKCWKEVDATEHIRHERNAWNP